MRPEWHDIIEVPFARHEKPGKPPSLKVDYLCGLVRYSEWVCFEHNGMARQKAVMWWNRRAANRPIPNSIETALAAANDTLLRRPVRTAVKKNGKFDEVVAVEF